MVKDLASFESRLPSLDAFARLSDMNIWGPEMRCRNCRQKNPGPAKFCNYCGAEFNTLIKNIVSAGPATYSDFVGRESVMGLLGVGSPRNYHRTRSSCIAGGRARYWQDSLSPGIWGCLKKEGRSSLPGSLGLCFRKRFLSTEAMGAAPMGVPGWPLLVCGTVSIARHRIVLMQSSSSLELFKISSLLSFRQRPTHLRAGIRCSNSPARR